MSPFGFDIALDVSPIPDDKHLFVSIIDVESRRLVETIRTEVAGVMMDDPRTLFVVDHDGLSLEASEGAVGSGK